MKAKVQQPSNLEISRAFLKIVGLFFVTVVILAGADLIDQLMIWIK